MMENMVLQKVWQQGQRLTVDDLSGCAFTGEDNAHTFEISGKNASGAVAISGTIAGKFLRSDNVTVPVTGSTSGGMASITLTEDCYAVPGRFIFSVYANDGTHNICIYCGVGNVLRTDSGEYEGGEIITDVTALINAIETAVATIPADYSTLLAAVAPTFSASTAYAAGSYVWYDGTLYKFTADHTAGSWTGTDAAAVALANDVADLKSALDSIGTHGKNMFNVATATDGKYYKANGTEVNREGLSHSEFIAVNSSETIYISRAVGSQTFPTVVQFDENKDVISGSEIYQANTPAFSFDTNATAKYIVVNYSTSYGSGLMVSNVNSTFEAYKIVGTGNASQYNMYSADEIRYDGTNIISKSNIYLITFNQLVNFGTSVNVGSGKFLYYNETTKSLFASNEREMSETVYFVKCLSTKQHDFVSMIRNSVSLEYDAINHTVTVLRANGFLYYNGSYVTTTGDPVTLTQTGSNGHILVYYKLSTGEFGITNSYSDILNDCIVIMEAYNGVYNAICPVKRINNDYALALVKLYTFGDSLTWYNNNEFTWGEHEGELCIGFQTYLQRYCKMELKSNYGVSGKTTPQICGIIKNNISNIADNSVVTIMGGDNDDRLGVALGTLQPVGGTFDTSTVYGALQDAIESLLTAKPTTRIIMMTEPMGWTYTDSAMKRVSDLIPNAYRRVAEQYGLPLIDLWNESGINELTRNMYYADPTPATNHSYMYHPNNDGWKRLSKIICREIMKV